MNSRPSSTSTSPTRSSNPLTLARLQARRAQAHPSALESIVRRLHQALPAFNERRLTWDDAVGLANLLGAPVVIQRSGLDAYLARRFGGHRVVVDRRLNQESWGVFCVLHELVHLVAHPGPREFYLGSPGWHSHTEAQANTIAMLALSAQPRPPYPRILKAEPNGALMALTITYVTNQGSIGDVGPRWISRKVTLQRYQ